MNGCRLSFHFYCSIPPSLLPSLPPSLPTKRCRALSREEEGELRGRGEEGPPLMEGEAEEGGGLKGGRGKEGERERRRECDENSNVQLVRDLSVLFFCPFSSLPPSLPPSLPHLLVCRLHHPRPLPQTPPGRQLQQQGPYREQEGGRGREGGRGACGEGQEEEGEHAEAVVEEEAEGGFASPASKRKEGKEGKKRCVSTRKGKEASSLPLIPPPSFPSLPLALYVLVSSSRQSPIRPFHPRPGRQTQRHHQQQRRREKQTGREESRVVTEEEEEGREASA